MKLFSLFNEAVNLGRRYDPRGRGEWNYADSAVLYGKKNFEVKKILVGIDVEVGELLLADKLRNKQGLDLVIAHHPEGYALAHFYEVMKLQIDMLQKAGIQPLVAKQLVNDRLREVQRRISPVNHMRSQDAARLLDMPFICLHTPADNHASFFIHKILTEQKPKRLSDVIDILESQPEYKDAKQNNAGPRIILGNLRGYVGKVFVEMTGGTEGSKYVFPKLAKTGIRTLVSMHLSEEHFQEVRKAGLNAVIAGHISSDTLGLNLLLDGLEKKEHLEILGCSGFRRFRRLK